MLTRRLPYLYVLQLVCLTWAVLTLCEVSFGICRRLHNAWIVPRFCYTTGQHHAAKLSAGSDSFSTYETKAYATSIQDTIICFECLPAALIFAHSFPARDYMRPGEMPGSIFDNIVDMFDVRDVAADVNELVDDHVSIHLLVSAAVNVFMSKCCALGACCHS